MRSLGGFYQLMNFLGTIGYLMEGSGLREAMETVYAKVTVGHLSSGKAYSKALRGHMICALASLSIIFSEYKKCPKRRWNS